MKELINNISTTAMWVFFIILILGIIFIKFYEWKEENRNK